MIQETKNIFDISDERYILLDYALKNFKVKAIEPIYKCGIIPANDELKTYNSKVLYIGKIITSNTTTGIIFYDINNFQSFIIPYEHYEHANLWILNGTSYEADDVVSSPINITKQMNILFSRFSNTPDYLFITGFRIILE